MPRLHGLLRCSGLALALCAIPRDAGASPWRIQQPLVPAPPPPAAEPPASEVVDPFTTPSSTAAVADPSDRPPALEHHAAGTSGYRPRVGDPPSDGTGLLVGGGVLFGVGTACVGGGLALIGAPTDNFSDGFAATIGGILLISIGVPPVVSGVVMLGVGGSRRAAYNRWRRVSLAPSRTLHGTWVAGLRLAF